MLRLPSSFLLAAALACLSSAHAGIFIPVPHITSSETLTGGAGRVNIVEVEVTEPFDSAAARANGFTLPPGPGLSETWVGYYVDVQSPGVSVASFAVSLSSLSTAISIQRGWGGTTITANTWNTGTILPNGALSTSLGSYNTFFEPESPAIAFFWADNKGGGVPIDESNDQDPAVQNDPSAIRFRLASNSVPFSSTLVFGSGASSGSVIDGSTIPEPSVTLLGLAALGLILRRRR